MRKFLFSLILTALIAVSTTTSFKKTYSASASAQSEIAMELSTGTVLKEGNADARLPMASTTKILTAIIIIEDCNLDEVITVPDEAVGVEGSSIYLKKEEQISVKDLVYGLMLRSGNDSATALALHHSGSIENFAQAMNERAKKAGAENSNFKNPSGLPDDEHYTTARDLCKIACYAMKNSLFIEVVSTTNYKGEYRNFVNKNKMLYKYDGANGVKTGYTLKAGRCLVSSAERNGMDVVCVVLNCYDMYEHSCKVFDYCFANYKLLNLEDNKVFMCDRVPCKLEISKVNVVKCKGDIDFRVKPLEVKTAIKKGDYIGDLEIYSENNLLFSEKLYSIIDV